MTITQNDKFVYFTLHTAKEMYSFSNAVMEHTEYDTPFMEMLDEATEKEFKPIVEIDYLEDGNSMIAKAFCYNEHTYNKCDRTITLLLNWINLNS